MPPDAAARPQDLRLGASLVIGAALIFATLTATVKGLGTSIPNEMLVWARNFFALLFLIPVLLRHPPSNLLTRHWKGHLVRTISGLLAMYCLFWAIPRLNVAEALVLNHTATLFIPFIALLWLKEPVSARTGTAIAVGFVGIVVLLRPGGDVFSLPGLVGLTSGLFSAIAMVSIRSMAGKESTTRIVFYFTVFATVFSSIPLLWAWQTPSLWEWLAMAAIGGMAAGGQLLLTRGYMSAPAAQVGPFIYASVIFGATYGWLFWGETMDGWTWTGIALVVAAGALVAFRFRRPRRPVLY